MNAMKSILKGIIGWRRILARIHRKGSYISPFARIKKIGRISLAENARIQNARIANDRGDIELLAGAYVNDGCSLLADGGDFRLGENSFLNDQCMVIALADVIIGKDVMVGPRCCFVAGNHSFGDIQVPMIQQGYTAKGIRVADDVWIGINSTITDGVSIGRGSVIAAGSVVTKDVGEYEIWGGVPARLLRNRAEPKAHEQAD